MGYDTWISGTLTVIKAIPEGTPASEALEYFTNKEKAADVGADVNVEESFRGQDEEFPKLIGYVTGELHGQGDDSEDMWEAVFYPHGMQFIGAEINYPGLESLQKCIDGDACKACVHQSACSLGKPAPGFSPRATAAPSKPASAGFIAAQAGRNAT